MAEEKQNKKLIKKESKRAQIERVLKPLTETFDFSDDNWIVEEYVKLDQKSKLTPREEKRKDELRLEIGMIYGLKNGAWVVNLGHSKYYKSLATIRSSLIKEYNCKTPLELMLVDRIVASYWRAMRCDTIFNHFIEKEDGSYSFNQLKVNVMKEFNKALELSSRQLNANIILLKELKQPKLNVKVRTDSAFIAQNQQLNINPLNRDKPNENENIEPK